MKTAADVGRWIEGAAARFGDPAIPVCQLFFRWVDKRPRSGEELYAGQAADGMVELVMGEFTVPVKIGPGMVMDDNGLVAFGADRICAGVWALQPSLNIEGVIHGFVVLYDVPDPAPWERGRIILP